MLLFFPTQNLFCHRQCFSSVINSIKSPGKVILVKIFKLYSRNNQCASKLKVRKGLSSLWQILLLLWILYYVGHNSSTALETVILFRCFTALVKAEKTQWILDGVCIGRVKGLRGRILPTFPSGATFWFTTLTVYSLKNRVWKMRPIQKSLKPAFFLTAGRGRLHWLQE